MSQNLHKLQEIGHLLRTQDNRITEAPFFIIQQKVRDYGIADGFTDDYEWVNSDEQNTADEKLARILGMRHAKGKSTWGYELIGYRDRWEFVTACFTEQGCIDYLKINAHNLKETRIYAYGSFRNQEYRAVRKHLMGLPEPGTRILTIPIDPRYPTEQRPLVTSAMKAECIGDFHVEVEHTCPHCYTDEADPDCEVCKGAVTYTIRHQVPWNTMKEIYRAMVQASVKEANDGK